MNTGIQTTREIQASTDAETSVETSTGMQASTGIRTSIREQRPTVTFGARAAILAGVVVTACAATAPAAAHALTTHPATHSVTAVALGGTSSGLATALDTTAGE